MAKSVQKISLSASRDIPFDRLVLSQANVRRVKAGVSIEELAADIARRTLLQSITVRPVLDEAGAETGMFEIPAGGRRYRALELLVKQKRLAKTAPIPCVVRTEGIAEEDSLAENIQRAPLLGSVFENVLSRLRVCHDGTVDIAQASQGRHGRRPGQAFPQRSEDNAYVAAAQQAFSKECRASPALLPRGERESARGTPCI